MARYYKQDNALPHGVVCPENEYIACQFCGEESGSIEGIDYCSHCETLVEGYTIFRHWGVEDELGIS